MISLDAAAATQNVIEYFSADFHTQCLGGTILLSPNHSAAPIPRAEDAVSSIDTPAAILSGELMVMSLPAFDDARDDILYT